MPRQNKDRDSNSTAPPDSIMETAIIPFDSTQPAESLELCPYPSLGDNPGEADLGSFPFLRLPIEIRTMVYLELLVPAETVRIYAQRTWPARNMRATIAQACRQQHVAHNGVTYHVPLFLQTFREVSLTSRCIYRESVPIFFSYNTFEFEDFECIPSFLNHLTPNSRRAIANVKLWYVGKGPAAAFKMLATCVGLRRLDIIFHECETTSLMQRSFRCVMNLHGLGDCLKLRGLTYVDVHRDGHTYEFFEDFFADLPKLREALQVLKQPQNPARLARLDKKDYPNRLHRSVFGKANVTTRMENKVMGTIPQCG